MKKGYLIFNGGEAFDSSMYESDRAWMRLVRGNRRPRVVVVPVAAMSKHQKIAYETCKYFNRMDTQADYKLITDQSMANMPTEFEILNKTDVIILTDGSPIDMIERIRGTHTEKALHMALERKAVIYGTGASAMTLGAAYWFAHDWLPGLGLAPKLALLPHYNLIAGRLSTEKLLGTLPEGLTLVGLDQYTNVIYHPDDTCEVQGKGKATVYRSVKQLDTYGHGKTFTLNPSPDEA